MAFGGICKTSPLVGVLKIHVVVESAWPLPLMVTAQVDTAPLEAVNGSSKAVKIYPRELVDVIVGTLRTVPVLGTGK
jgi:hypothetical protein